MSACVSEVSVDRIKPGYKVSVTGDGFPGLTLHGYVQSVASQANQNNNDSSQSQFDVLVNIPQVSALDRKTIRVGMTAHVDISIPNTMQLYVPISAVITHNGKTYVNKVENNKITMVPVVTGETSVDSVVIIKGLKKGDKISIPLK